MPEVVAVIGASDKPERYSNMALHALKEHGHEVVLVNPFKSNIEGQHCYTSVGDYEAVIDTVTLYVNPLRFHDHIDEVIKARPRRVIMNPGTEDDEHERALNDAGIETLRACTLVLLSTGNF